MSRNTETITLSIQKGTKQYLEEIAAKFNLYWGDRPSVSGLLNAIAGKEVVVMEPLFFNQLQIESIEEAIKLLVDSGRMQSAQILIELILEKGNSENKFRQDLTQKLRNQAQAEAWRRVIDNYINQRQPFYLLYQDHHKQEQFHVTYGKIRFYEQKLYLTAWCEEENENSISELNHNYTFRLDKIINAFHYPAKWRYQGLNHIQVQLNFYHEMIDNYEKQEEDLDIQKLPDKLEVIKRIDNPFWLIKELLIYGDKCEVISPITIRESYIQEWQKIGERYQQEIVQSNSVLSNQDETQTN